MYFNNYNQCESICLGSSKTKIIRLQEWNSVKIQ